MGTRSRLPPTKMDTARHLDHLAESLCQLAPGMVYWSGVGFLDDVPEALRHAVGQEWGALGVEAYLSYLAIAKPLSDKRLTVVLAAPCPPDQLEAIRTLEAAGALGCVAILERRKPTTFGGWPLNSNFGPFAKRPSATGSYLEELGFHDAGQVEWNSDPKSVSRLESALLRAVEEDPGYVLVICPDTEPECELGVQMTEPLKVPRRLSPIFGADKTVYGAFSRQLSQKVSSSRLLWLDSTARDTPEFLEQHLQMFRDLESSRNGRPVVVVPSLILPVLYRSLRIWCQDESSVPPILVLHGTGLPGHWREGGGGLSDGHFLLSIANLSIAYPADEFEADALFEECLAQQAPGALVFSGAPAVGMRSPASLGPGKGRKLRDGKDLAIVALGSTVYPALLAAESLQAVGLDVGVFDLRYRRPLDEALLEEISVYPLLVAVDEQPETASFAGQIQKDSKPMGRLVRLCVDAGGLQEKMRTGSKEELSLESVGLHAEGIARTVMSTLGLGLTNHFER